MQRPKPSNLSPHQSLDSQLTKVFVFSVWGVSLLLTCIVLWFSRTLRPIADDYSIGVFASQGLMRGAMSWLSLYTGDVVAVLTNLLVVGLPLVYLPWSLASAIPFFATSLAVLTPIALLLVRSGPSIWKKLAFSVPILFISYWAYWWTSAVSEFFPYSRPEALSASFWQNVNASYIITLGLLTSSWIALEVFNISDQRLRFMSWGALGLVTGFVGPVIGITAIVMSALLAVVRSREENSWRTSFSSCYTILGASAMLALTASYLSPGTQARLQLFPSRDLNLELVWSSLTAAGSAVTLWIQGIFTPGTLTVLVLVSTTTFGAALLGVISFKAKAAFKFSIALTAASLVFAVTSGVAEVFAYPGYWHVLPSRVLWWWAIVVFGATIGVWLSSRSLSAWGKTAIEGASLAALLAAILSLTAFANTAAARAVVWTEGPAPLFPLYDRESPEVSERWQTLQRARES